MPPPEPGRQTPSLIFWGCQTVCIRHKLSFNQGVVVVPCVGKEEGGDAYLGCLISSALAFTRNPRRCLIIMTNSDIGLLQNRMSLTILCR
jgi:hypothetical protein